MTTRLKSRLWCLAAGSALLIAAQAGTKTWTFDTDPALDPDPLDMFGSVNDQPWQETDGNPGGFIALTYPENSQAYSIIFPDIDDGATVSAFTLEADLRVGNPEGSRAADGFSVSFCRADDPFLASRNTGQLAATLPEAGTVTGLAISFDTWQGNTLPDTADIEGIIVRVDNVTVKKTALSTRNGACADATSLQTGPRDADFWATAPAGGYGGPRRLPESWDTLCWQRLSVTVDAQSRITVIWKGQKILDNYQSTFFPSAGRIVLSGRTGGANEHTHFDNITLTTTTSAADTTPPTTPTNLRADVTGAYRIVLAVDPSTDDSGRVGYEIERNGTMLAGAYPQPVNDLRGLTPSTPYAFRVRATDVAGNKSDWTPILNVTTVAEVDDPPFAGAKQYSDGETGLGTAVSSLINNPIYPASPTTLKHLNSNAMSFGEPAFGDTWGDNHGVRIAGTVTPPETGDYHFFIRSDDASQLYLNVEGPQIPEADDYSYIATETGCCEAFKEPGPDQPYETTTTPISLQAGKKYGILFLVKEGGGGDWGQVAWRKVGDTTAAASLGPIGGGSFESEVVPKWDPVGAVVTITQQPQSVTVAANSPQTFTVVAQTASPYSTTVLHQWYRNGAAILGATGTSYTIPFVPAAENGAKYTVRVAVLGKYVLSSEATLTVTDDITPPTIGVGGVHGTQDLSHVTVQFSEPVTDPSATTAGNYTMTPALAVTAATRVNATTVQLTTATQTQNTKYTLTVNNVKDVAGLAIAANTKVDWMSWVVPGTVGPITVEIYDGAGGATAGAITGTTVADLLAWGGYPASPDVTTTITGSWNSRLFYADDTHENFGARMTGLITPSETGDYRFFVYSDDSSQLWLSTDTTEAKLVKIAEETGCCEAFREPPSEQVSAPIHLIAGTSYLMRGIYKEGGGGDYMQVAWRKEGNPIPASALTPMPGVFDPWGGAPATGLKGADFEAGGTATLSVEGALGLRPLSYKWQKTGPADSHTDIAGATSATLTIPNASLADVGAYRCLITNPAGTTTTREVVLTLKKSFLIEAEDFDYNGGQHQAVADTMPYAGFAYDGLSAKYDVDYHNDNNDSITYRRGGDLAVAGHGASMDNSTGNVLSLQRGAWDVVNNYKIGWINGGDWHNYTRAIPAGSYTAFAALSYGDTSATGLKATLNKVTAGVGTTTQTLEALGGFDQAGSGAWGRNSLVALKDGTGAAAVFNIAGPVTTLRMSHTSGDFDWLMLVPFAEAEDIQIDVKLNADGTITIAWNGGGVLQAATSLLGPWQDVTSTSPYTFAPQAGVPYMFGRIKK